MSTTITTDEFTVNRFSDFSLSLSLTKDGESYAPESFKFAFYTDKWTGCDDCYIASCIDGEYTNCSVDGTTITIYFDSPGFNLGDLKCRFVDLEENENFTDGYLGTCTPITLPIEVVVGAGDTDTIELGYSTLYFGDDNDLVIEGSNATYGDDNDLEI